MSRDNLYLAASNPKQRPRVLVPAPTPAKVTVADKVSAIQMLLETSERLVRDLRADENLNQWVAQLDRVPKREREMVVAIVRGIVAAAADGAEDVTGLASALAEAAGDVESERRSAWRVALTGILDHIPA